jgi:hypothetical protein
MQLPETPDFLRELDLMKRLAGYEKGDATWHNDRGIAHQSRETDHFVAPNG